ncbi:calmodulin CAM1 [Besnoitia besnoiti]|uniref:Calmodulin CAM1 n=1 Tax=Besnoitia besnoiti TaxID=94643 RepID=A0A2A9MQI3_BESBE|nr:calmodulin CAM1 [Besnoitia besnoiti]PFH38272.1 calmodulin CAM1 [Besnoitia besnoiti]
MSQKSRSAPSGGATAASAGSVPARLRAHTAELESIFKRMDIDGDGKLSEEDLTAFMKERVDYPLDRDQVKAIIMELRGSGKTVETTKGSFPPVDFPTFLGFIDCQLMKPLPDLLGEIFQHMDTDKDGKLTAREVQTFAERLDIKLGVDGASELLNRGHQETAATFEEFCGLVQKALPSVGR